MLLQSQVDMLLSLLKKLSSMATIGFPSPGSNIVLPATDSDAREVFLLDVQRKGRIKVTKCTYQERYQHTEILLRLDVDGPPHENPDGEEIPCPHIHIYKEGFADKWAYRTDATVFFNTADLESTLRDFLTYCKIVEIPEIQRSMS